VSTITPHVLKKNTKTIISASTSKAGKRNDKNFRFSARQKEAGAATATQQHQKTPIGSPKTIGVRRAIKKKRSLVLANIWLVLSNHPDLAFLSVYER
jgi:hypothetical protein